MVQKTNFLFHFCYIYNVTLSFPKLHASFHKYSTIFLIPAVLTTGQMMLLTDNAAHSALLNLAIKNILHKLAQKYTTHSQYLSAIITWIFCHSAN